MRVRTGNLYFLQPAGADSWDGRVARWKDHIVRVIQPHGCPKNGTMGHCFVETQTGEFIGLVLVSSLQPIDKKTWAAFRPSH